MKNNLFLFLILVIITGCTECEEQFEFDGSEKYIVTGYVTDSSGQPLDNILVSVNNYSASFFDQYRYNYEDEVSTQSAYTNSDGFYECLFTGANTDFRILQFNAQIIKYYSSIDDFSLKKPIDANLQIKEVLIDCDQFIDYSKQIDVILGEGSEIRIKNNLDRSVPLLFSHDGRSDLQSTQVDDIVDISNQGAFQSIFVQNQSDVRLMYSTDSITVDTTFFVDQAIIDYAITN